MQKIFFLTIVVLCSISFLSCKKFLEEKPKSQLSIENFYRNQGDAIAAVNACYDRLGNNGVYHFATTTALIIPSANIYTKVDRWKIFDNYTYTSAENECIPALYRRVYEGIMSCNAALENIPNVEMDETLKNRLIGEAKFLRAYYYFLLVRSFGRVPIVTKIELDNPSRDSVEDVYKQIENDLKDSEEVLPWIYSSNSDIGRATKGAVLGLEARVHLTKKEWDKVLDKTGQIIDEGLYTLWDDYSEAFGEAANFGKENLFEVGFASGLGSPTDGEGNILSYYTTPPTSLAFSEVFIPTIAFYNSFETGDRRREWGLITSKEVNGQLFNFEPHIIKYTSSLYWVGAIAGWDAAINIPLIRYSDILLMRAEALNEVKNGPDNEAFDLINQVRLRSQIPRLILGDYNQEEFRQAVYVEREHELYFEMEDWFDLVRTGRLISEHQKIGISVDDKYKLFPIPIREIDVSDNIIVQNPGY